MPTERPLTQAIPTDGQALSLQGYEHSGGYQGLRKALHEMTPQKVQEEVKNSGLRGRGGAGFPTGLKWSFTPMGADTPRPKYVIANADEMEPGTFKDRHLMEGNPHQLIEGLILAAYANQADIAFIFIRGEYKLSQERLARAIAEAYSAGYLGTDILKSGYGLEMYLHISAGRYMCGEETGLLNALEGKRANPRAKPPFPQVSGLWGKPTIVNNVETLVNVWRQRKSQASRPMGTADGDPAARDPGRACGRHARWAAVSRSSSRRRLHGFSRRRASRCANGLHRSPKGREPPWDRNHDRP